MFQDVTEQFIKMLLKYPVILNENAYREDAIHEQMLQIFQDVCEKERYYIMCYYITFDNFSLQNLPDIFTLFRCILDDKKLIIKLIFKLN